MTATQAPTPSPLSGDDVKLLVKGDLLRRTDGRISIHGLEYESGLSGTYLDGTTHANSPWSHFSFIGRPDESGWMPWSGGENPVGKYDVAEIKRRDGTHVIDAAHKFDWLHSPRQSDPDDIIAFRLAPTAPVEASGSELTSAQRRSMSIQAARPDDDTEAAGCAEPQVGRAVYERIEKLLTTDPQGWERDYLCHLVESVEELGGYDGPRLDGRNDRQAVADFLKLRDESVGHSEVDDAERLESADAILAALRPQPSGETRPTDEEYARIHWPSRADGKGEG